MKRSKYNIYTEFNNRYFIFNTLNTDSIEVYKEDYQFLKSDLPIKKSGFKDPAHYYELVRARFLVRESTSEIEKLRQIYKKEQLSKDVLTLTIAPSLFCNFACPYCYENKNNYKMSLDEQEILLKFIEVNLADGYKRLNIVWFGGEPLASFKIITDLSYKILDLVKKYKVKYHATITTNAYLITDDIARTFKKIGIKQVYTTIDGLKETHNKRRMLKNGKGTFDVLIENIKLLKKYKLDILVRMNVDKTNIKDIKPLSKFIQKDLKLPFYLGHVRQFTKECDPDKTKYLSRKEFTEIDVEHNKWAKNYFNLGSSDIFKTRSNYCRACKKGTYVVDPRLNIFRCENDIGNSKKALKNLKDLFNKKNNSFRSVDKANDVYYDWDPFSFEKCQNCELLPLCIGGCPYIGINNTEPECDFIKYSADYYLNEYLKHNYSIV